MIDRGKVRLALHFGQELRLLGLLTEGDVRRAILSGAALEDPVETFLRKDFVWVKPADSRHQVLDLMQGRRIKQVPVLNQSRQLVGLHLLDSMVPRNPLPNVAVLLAGGKGARLETLTQETPKPMLRVAGRPVLERLVHHLVGHGIQDIYLSVNYLKERIEEHFEDGARFGCRIQYLHEPEYLGTAGPLSLLPERPEHSVVVANGDLVTQFDLRSALESHLARNLSVTVGIKTYQHRLPFGVVTLDGERVLEINEKPTHRARINAGIYILEPTVLQLLEYAQPMQMIPFIRSLIKGGYAVGAQSIEADWIDIGEADALKRARGEH